MTNYPSPDQNQQYPGQQPPAYPAAAGASTAALQSKPKKPWFKKWWAWLLGLILIIALANAVGGGGSQQATSPAGQQTTAAAPQQTAAAAPQQTAAAAPQQTAAAAPQQTAAQASGENDAPKQRLTLDKGWRMDKSNQYAAMVKGSVRNNTDEAINSYVQITFDALDQDGANLGTCLANTNTIDAHGKWKFEATCTGDAKEISRIRFKDLSGF